MDLHVITNFRYQISTFATKLGVRNIAFLGSGILLVNYIVSVLAAIYMPQVNINFQALVTRTGSYNFCNKLDLPGLLIGLITVKASLSEFS